MERDVYVERFFTRSGHYLLCAVDSKGRFAGESVVYDTDQWELAERILLRRLDKCDPLPERPALAVNK